MPTFNFDKQLANRAGHPFTTNLLGLGGVANLWASEQQYAEPIKVGTCFELLLLYTVDRQALARPAPHNVLSEQEKQQRWRLATKLGDNGVVELDQDEIKLLRRAITVLPTEPNYLLGDFLNNPEV